MATIRTSGASAIVNSFDAIGTAAQAISSTIGSAGRMATALHAKADAYATSIEVKAKLDKLDATELAMQNWAVASQERMLELNNRIKNQQLYDAMLEKAKAALA